METAQQRLQTRYDNQQPPDSMDLDDRIEAEIPRVLGLESKIIPFFDRRANGFRTTQLGFSLDASEALARACNHECMDVQLVLAILAGEYHRARCIAEMHFRQPLENTARRMVTVALRKQP